jgi:hypothetical protein
MELGELTSLAEEARQLVRDAVANVEEIEDAVTKAADACLHTGLLDRASACASVANRAKIVKAVGLAFREGIQEILTGLEGLGET